MLSIPNLIRNLSVTAVFVLVVVPAATAQFSLPNGVNLGIGVSPNNISGVATGDLDNDGFGDLVATDDASTGNVGLALGLSGGGYSVQAVVNDPAASSIGAFLPTLGDFDLDGNLDLVYAGTSPTVGATHAAVFVMRGVPGVGTYTFSPSATILVTPLPATITSIAITDYDGDGDQDILATVRSTVPAARTVTVIKNSGPFLFGPLHSTTTATGAAEIDVCVDFNKDGLKDLVICRPAQPGAPGFVDIYAGTGATNPLPPQPTISLPLPGQASPIDVHWVECDQKGGYDLAVLSEGILNGVFLIRNLGNPPFFVPSAITAPFQLASTPRSLHRLEVTFDGVEDLAVYGLGTSPTSVKPTSFELLRINDCTMASAGVALSGTFETAKFEPDVVGFLAAGDQQSDGLVDLILLNHSTAAAIDTVNVFTNVAQTSFAISPNRPLLGQVTPITFHIQGPTALAGNLFMVMFSRNGTRPGVPVGGMLLGLNPPFEPYSIFGTLDPTASGTFSTPPLTFPASPVTFSLQMAAAFLVQAPTPGTVGFISNPAVITLP